VKGVAFFTNSTHLAITRSECGAPIPAIPIIFLGIFYFCIMDDYRLALLLSVFVLIPLAGWKITGMVRKLQKMSRKEKELHDELTPKQNEFTQFLKKASNQSK